MKSEIEIIAGFDFDLPLLSICCVTYNHESYVAECLDGFLRQDTSFPFEILIYDDNSSDGTKDVIRSYYERYPKLISPILSDKRNKPLGYRMNPHFNFQRARGEFIAMIDGDDYWTSSSKITTQLNAMLANPAVDISFHRSEDSSNRAYMHGDRGSTSKVFTLDEVVSGGGGFMPTSSLMFRANSIRNLPAWFTDYAPVGDYYLQMLGSVRGGALYLPESMTCYRTDAAGSWTNTLSNRGDRSYLKLARGHRICLPKLRKFGASGSAVNNALFGQFAYCAKRAGIALDPKAAFEIMQMALGSLGMVRSLAVMPAFIYGTLLKVYDLLGLS